MTPSQVVAPDVFVVRGLAKGNRRTYKIWEEGKAPDVIFELTSPCTRAKDLGVEKGLYELWGVREYFLFDPLGDYLKPALQGYRLTQSGYRRIASKPFVSEVLGLELRVEKNLLRLYDPQTGEKLLSPLEAQAARRRAEAELKRLRAELARLRGKQMI